MRGPSTTRSGPLAQGTLPGLLKELYLGRSTGLLSCVRGWERRSVRFIGGNVVHADTNGPGGHLGDLLVRHGLLQREQLSEALALSRRQGKRLGVVLVEQGLLERGLLDDALVLHVVDTLVKVFSWPDGQWDFLEQDAEAIAGHDLTLGVSTGDLILKAARGVEDPDVIRYCLGDLDRVLHGTGDPLLRFQRLELDPEHAFLLSRVDGRLRAREVLALAPGEPGRALRALFGLLCVGLVEFAPAAPQEDKPAPEALRREILEAAAGLASRTQYQVLGLSRAAGAAELRSAHLRLAQRYHPDLQHDPALADLKPQIEALFTRVCQAGRLLADPERRAAYDATLLRQERRGAGEAAPAPGPRADPQAQEQRAAELLAEAESCFSRGRYWDALQLCEDLLPLAGGKTRRRARVLLGECCLRNPHWRRHAEEELLGAVREDPRNVEALLLLGVIYRDAGLPARAAAMFRNVLELRPRNAVAARELAALRGSRAGGVGRFIKLPVRRTRT